MTAIRAELARAMPAVAFAAYAAHRGVNASILKGDSPLHMRAIADGVGQEDSYSRQALRAVHCLALEGSRSFAAAFAVMPPGMTRRGAAWEAHRDHATQTGRVCITTPEAELVTARARAVRRHAVSGRWLADRHRLVERMAVWADPETGLLCKGRPDLVVVDEQARRITVADLKTWGSTHPAQVATQIARQKVHMQVAHYLAGTLAVLAGAGHRIDGWTIEGACIVVEDRPPHDVGVYLLAVDGALLVGETARRAALTTWAAAVASGAYPGRCPEAVDTILPTWAAPELADGAIVFDEEAST